ncbi:hypothetical protein HAX54_043412 [Datura stramonium]|uniref:Uncharacterized protein n=1 Tax=Datura stramonium TaxID=4076 RepID=A0ABS8SN39_DATST|nr:hypothetical protein [Datura stramonium]
MSLDYHFTVEQEVGSSTHAFFGFNGTGGVWRIAAINEAGGWKDRTTVEDMDFDAPSSTCPLLRNSLKGWKFVYLSDLRHLQSVPFSAASLVVWPGEFVQENGDGNCQEQESEFWKKFYDLPGSSSSGKS